MTDGLERIAEGREAEVFLRADGLVVKLMRDPGFVDRVQAEAAAVQALDAAGVRVARVHEIVEIDGRPGLIIDRIAGIDLLNRVGRNPLLIDRIARAMAYAHAAMHEVTAPSSLPDLHDDLRQRIERADPMPAELRAPVLATLDALPRGDRLCHGDLHPGNMLGEVADPVVIDWGGATRGNATGDVVRSALLLRVGKPGPGASMALSLLAFLGGAVASMRYVKHYRSRRAIDVDDFAKWRIVRAAARLAENIPEENATLLKLVRRDLA